MNEPGGAPIRVELVVAMARNRVIGREGGMPWHVSSDLKHFRRLTLDKPVIMGRKTFQSIGKPLDRRDNIVVTRDRGFSAKGIHVVGSVDAALALGRTLAGASGADAVMVIGGGEIYAQSIAVADVIHVSLIDLEPTGDTAFPPLDPAVWDTVHLGAVERGPRDDAGFERIEYRRKSPQHDAVGGDCH